MLERIPVAAVGCKILCVFSSLNSIYLSDHPTVGRLVASLLGLADHIHSLAGC